MVMYLFKVNIAFILLFGFYKLMFTEDTFFSWRRITLVGLCLTALLIPGLDFSAWIGDGVELSTMAEGYASFVHPTVTVSSLSEARIDWGVVAKVIYINVLTLLLIRFLWQLSFIISLRDSSQTYYVNGVKVYRLKGNESPFSFFKWIFINPDRHGKTQLDEIMTHELAHSKQWHSVDMLFVELFVIFLWFNPAVWLLRREVRLNLEYLADENVLASGLDRKEYQYHLLGVTFGKKVATISNNFNVLPIKKRIKMMNKKETKGFFKVRYMLYVPLVAMLLAVSNIETIARNVTKTSANVEMKKKQKKAPGKVYAVAETMPSFNGNLYQWLAANIRYPVDAESRKEQGRVLVKFIVTAKGEVVQPEIVKSVTPSLDKEALRVVSLMPKWNPGKNGKKKVAVRYMLPISFALN